MYNAHRGMAPGPQPGAIRPGERLAELLDQVRAEFEAHTQRSNENEHSCELHLLFRAQVKARPVVGMGKEAGRSLTWVAICRAAGTVATVPDETKC